MLGYNNLDLVDLDNFELGLGLIEMVLLGDLLVELEFLGKALISNVEWQFFFK